MSLVPAEPNPLLSLGRALPPPQFHNSLVVPSIPPPSPLSREISELAKQSFLTTDSRLRDPQLLNDIGRINQEFAWKAAQIGALFSAMYSAGIATEEDPRKIKDLFRDVDELERELAVLPHEKQPAARAKLQTMRKQLEQLHQFSMEMERIGPAQKRLEEAWNRLGNCIDTPPQSLMGGAAIQEAIESLKSMEREIAGMFPVSKSRMQWAFEKEVKFLGLSLLDLEETAENWVDQEVKYLAKAWNRAKPEEKEAIGRQIKALLDQQNQLLESYRKLQGTSIKTIADRLREGESMAAKQQKPLLKLWGEVQKEHKDIRPLAYGSAEWQAIIEQRPASEKGWVAKKLEQLNPENWSDTTKRWVHGFLTLNQLVAQGVGGYKQLQRDVKGAHLMLERARTLTPDQERKIASEEGALGKILKENYPKTKEQLETRFKKHPEAKKVAEEIVTSHGTKAPTQEEIDQASSKLRDTMRTTLQEQNVRAAFKPLTTAQWWEAFTTKEEVQQPSVSTESTPLALPSGMKEEKAEKPKGWMSKMVETVGSLFTAQAQEPAVSQESFAIEKRSEGALKLRDAWGKLAKMEQNSMTADMSEVILRNIQEAPLATASLSELAAWLLRVDDTAHGVTQLEKQTVPSAAGSLLADAAIAELSQKDSSVRQLHGFLTKPQDQPVNDRMFAHLAGHANPSLKGTKVAGEGLEGSTHYYTISYQLNVAQTLLNTMKESATEPSLLCCQTLLGDPGIASSVKHNPGLLQDLVRQLSIAQAISNPHQSYENYRQIITENVQTLKVGESFFIPGGWNSRSTGHATTWVVTKQADGNLTVQPHNSGAGLQYHIRTEMGLKQKYLNALEIVDVKPEQLTSEAFLGGTWTLRSSTLPGEYPDWSEIDLYEGLLIGLGGQVQMRDYAASDFNLPQFIGICAMESIMATIGTALSTDTSARLFRFWTTLKGTVSYFDQYKSTLTDSEERRRLLADGLKTLSVVTRQAAEAGALTDSELTYTRQLITKMREELAEADKRALEIARESQAPVTFSIPPHAIQKLSFIGLYATPDSIEATQAAVRGFSPIAPVTLKKENLIPELNRLAVEIHKGNHETHNYLEVQKAIKSTILQIPLGGEFWNGMTDETAQQLLSSLANFSKEYLWSFLHNDERPPEERFMLSPDDYLCQSKMLALSDYIVLNFNNPLDLKLPSLMQNLVFEIPHIIPLQASLEWKEEEAKLMSYWQQKYKTINTLIGIKRMPQVDSDPFGFNNHPAGHTGFYKRRFGINEDFKFVQQRYSPNQLIQNRMIPDEWIYGNDQADAAILHKWVLEHLEQVAAIDPTLTHLPVWEQVEALYKNLDKIPAFRDAFTVSFVHDYLLTGSMADHRYQPGSLDFSKGIQMGVESFKGQMDTEEYSKERERYIKQTRNLSCYGIAYSLFGQTPAIDRNEQLKATMPLDYDITPTHVVPLSHLLKAKTQVPNHDLQRIFARPPTRYGEYERCRIDSHAAALIDPRAETPILSAIYHNLKQLDISVQQFRELLALSSAKEFQIPQTLGYFSLNSHLLQKPHFQVYFRLLMTESLHLENWLSQHPQAVDELSAFYSKLLQNAEEIGDANLATFAAGMSARLEYSYNYVKLRNPDLFKDVKPQFLPAQTTLLSVINAKDATEEQRALASREMVISFRGQQTLNEEQATRLLQAMLYGHYYPVPESYRSDPEMQREFDLMIRNQFPKVLKELLDGPERDTILTNALRSVLPTAPLGQWTSPHQFPYYLSPDGVHEINVLDGRFKTRGHSPLPLNPDLRKNPYIQQIFGSKPPLTMLQLSPKQVEISSGDVRYRLLGDHPWTSRLQRQFGQRWYQLQNETFGIENQALTDQTCIWYCDTDGKFELLFSDKQTGKILYLMPLSLETVRNKAIDEVIKLDNQEKDTGLRLVSSNLPEMAPFRRLEASEYILGWSRNGRLEQVELPRFGLSFAISEGKAVSEQLSGFALIEGGKQLFPELGDVPHYLHLQRKELDGSTSERIVFPRHRLQAGKGGPYLSESIPERDVKPNEVQPQRRYEYDVSKSKAWSGKRELIPAATNEQEATEANLYLAMILLSERPAHAEERSASPYAEALHYLKKAEQQMLRQREAIASGGSEILQWIGSWDADRHPDATALRLKALGILLRNNRDYAVELPTNFAEQLSKLYLEYLTHLDLVDAHLKIPRADELKILKEVLSSSQSDAFTYRFHQLTSAIDLAGPSQPIRESPPVVVKTRSDFTPKWLEDWANKPLPAIKSAILLRENNSAALFFDYYAIAKGELKREEAIETLKKGMGLDLNPGITTAQLLEEMRTALKMHLAVTSKSEDWFSPVLLAVLEKPEKFPLSRADLAAKYERLKEANQEIKKLPEQLKSIKWNLEDTKQNAAGWLKQKEEWTRNGKWDDYNEKRFQEVYTGYLLPNQKQYQKEYDQTSLKLQTAEKDVPELEMLLEQSLKVPAQMHLFERDPDIPFTEEHKPSERLIREQAGTKPVTTTRDDLSFAECINFDAQTPAGKVLQNPIVAQDALVRFIRERPGVSPATPPQDLFKAQPKNPEMRKLFQEAQTQLDTYSMNVLQTQYDISDSQHVTELGTVLAQNIAKHAEDLQAQEKQLLSLAHRGPEREGETALRELDIGLGSVKLLTLDELVRSYFQRDYEVLHARNPHLKKDEATEIFSRVERYLFDATYLQQERRLLGETKQLEETLVKQKPEHILQEHLRSFVDAATASRGYDPRAHPEYLVFEYYCDILLWKGQVGTLDALSKKERYGALVELAMGMGKSHVIAPLLSWLLADGEQIAALVMPEPLVSSMAKDIQLKSGPAFNQKLRTLPIKREPMTVERLNRLFENLDEIRRERIVLLWTASDIQSLFNQWVELQEQAHEAKGKGQWTPELFAEVRLKHQSFLKSFNLLIKSASLSVDEIQQVFDILQSHSFTFGAPQNVHTDIAHGIGHLFETILADPKLSEKIRWEFLKSSKGESFTEEGYYATVRDQLIDSLVARSISPADNDFKAFFARLSIPERQMIKQYLADRDATPGYHLLEKLPGDGGSRIRNELATLKEALNTILPKTAGKKPLVHFGLDEKGELVVPYHDGVPTVNSLFGSVLERMIYAAQYSLSQGISQDIVKQKLEQLQSNYRKAQALGQKPDLTEFQALVGKNSPFSLMKIKEADLPALTRLVNSNPSTVLKLTQEYRFPLIKVYPKEIESSAHVIPLLAKKQQGVRGMGGTLFNAATYPAVFQKTLLSDTQAKTLDLLRQRSSPAVATLPSLVGADAKSKIESIYSHQNVPPGSLIDATGTLSGEKNEDLARAMLQRLSAMEGSKIHGVVFYDGNVLKVVTKVDKHPIPYRRDMDKESLAALWDLSHIVGSDIPLGSFMQANMLVGRHVTLVSLMQGSWRLRGLAKGQKVHFMVPEEDKAIIRNMLREHLGEAIDEKSDLTLPQLIRYAFLN